MSEYPDFPAHMAQMMLLDSMCEICQVNKLNVEQFTNTFVCGTFSQIVALACIGLAAGRCCFQYDQLRKIYEPDVVTAGVKSELDDGDRSPQSHPVVVKSKRHSSTAENVGTGVQEAASTASNPSVSMSETNKPSVVCNSMTPGRDVITPSYLNTNFDVNNNEPEKK